MPVINGSNNRILPANARAADVAAKAIDEILPTQQRRYLSAFRVQGYEVASYHRLHQGKKCSCNSSGKQLNSRLGLDGKADQGTINELLSGVKEFTVSPYGGDDQRRIHNNEGQLSPFAPVNTNQGLFDIASIGDNDSPFAREVDTLDFGDNGPVNPQTLDEMVGDYDPLVGGYLESACPVCFGSGFVGGYTLNRGYRNVLTVTDVQIFQGALDVSQTPFAATCSYFEFAVILPNGATICDAFGLWNGIKRVPVSIMIDGDQVSNPAQSLKYCDGKAHLVTVKPFRQGTQLEFTHFEIQYGLSTESSYFEFPKMSSSSDTSVLDQLNPFGIVVSPDIPLLQSQDVIKDCTTGKTFMVKNVNDWNTKRRQVLGWECDVRVCQPQEIQNLLPKRNPQFTKNTQAGMVLDNQTGPRRT